ncbi:MAG TPA: class I SAM-dependent methyltransferase [Armatimonadota bacterium]|nr:class I SAM-dependent methyltransferase [Armatimonadota bacterium]
MAHGISLEYLAGPDARPHLPYYYEPSDFPAAGPGVKEVVREALERVGVSLVFVDGGAQCACQLPLKEAAAELGVPIITIDGTWLRREGAPAIERLTAALEAQLAERGGEQLIIPPGVENRVPNAVTPSTLDVELLARYQFAAGFAAGMRVLDLGSGGGYGSYLLAQAGAREVLGLDRDDRAIAFSQRGYSAPGLSYAVGDALITGLESESFDLVVCFEVLEHIMQHDELLSEIVRLLRPDGICLVSTPNRKVLRAQLARQGLTNVYHVRELFVWQFRELLDRYFHRADLLGQRLAPTWSHRLAEWELARGLANDLEGVAAQFQAVVDGLQQAHTRDLKAIEDILNEQVRAVNKCLNKCLHIANQQAAVHREVSALGAAVASIRSKLRPSYWLRRAWGKMTGSAARLPAESATPGAEPAATALTRQVAGLGTELLPTGADQGLPLRGIYPTPFQFAAYVGSYLQRFPYLAAPPLASVSDVELSPLLVDISPHLVAICREKRTAA